MDENNKTHVIALRAAAVLLVLVLMTTSVVSDRYARYVSSDAMQDQARVAAFVFDVMDTEGHYMDLTGIRMPGDKVTYKFTVTNHNGTTSEVDEEYYLTLKLAGSLPLVCTLTGGDSITLDGRTIQDPGTLSGTGNVHTFGASVQQNVDYVLTVTWPEDENDIKYSRAGLAELVLTVAAQQVD